MTLPTIEDAINWIDNNRAPVTKNIALTREEWERVEEFQFDYFGQTISVYSKAEQMLGCDNMFRFGNPNRKTIKNGNHTAQSAINHLKWQLYFGKNTAEVPMRYKQHGYPTSDRVNINQRMSEQFMIDRY